jgi:hypothetical protein
LLLCLFGSKIGANHHKGTEGHPSFPATGGAGEHLLGGVGDGVT